MTSSTETTEIRSERVLRATRSKVWRALTTAEGWAGWFSDQVEGEFQVGHTLTLNFGSYGTCYAIVAERRDEEIFAYRWHPGEDCPLDKYPETEMTTVRFELRDHPEGTHLTMIESGFDRLPTARRASATHLNTTGWAYELAEMAAWVERDERQLLAKPEMVRERVYQTSQEKLWETVATPEGWKRWLVEDVIGEFVEGCLVTLLMGQDTKGEMKVLEILAPERFVVSWHPGQRDGATWDKFPENEATVVEFTLTATAHGTHLRLVESGFERIPEERRVHSQELNAQGWSIMMDRIQSAVGGE